MKLVFRQVWAFGPKKLHQVSDELLVAGAGIQAKVSASVAFRVQRGALLGYQNDDPCLSKKLGEAVASKVEL